MARKNGLNRKEQIQCAKALADGIEPEAIAKKFKTTVKIVKRFTRERLDAAAAKAKARLEDSLKTKAEKKEKADIIKGVLDFE